MSRGKRYNGEKQLNMKKVYSLIIIVVLIILFVFGIKQILKADKETLSGKNIELKYNTLYTNGNWGVINSSGDVVIQPAYAEMIIIPNKTKPVFVCTYEVNYVDGIYKTKIINEKNEEIYIGYENYFVIQNIDENNNLWVEENVIKVQKNGKYGLINIDGAEVLPCEYDSITAMKGIKNSLIIKKENLVGIANSHGTIVVPVEYSDIASITKNYEDGYIVKNSESKFGVINQKGEVSVSCMYNEIKACTDGNMHIVKEGTTWKVILNNSTAYLEGKVANAVSINNGNVVINNNGKYGILNIEKGVMIPEEYQELIIDTYFRGNVSIPIMVTAFGDIICWEENRYVRMVKYRNGIFKGMSAGFEFFFEDLESGQYDKEYFDLSKYNQAVIRLGNLAYDECFGYVPLLGLGGSEKVDNLSKVKIREHIELITQMTGNIGM